MYTVVCMKWGDKYGPEYVNRLFNMVARNTTLPFKFVCFTDDAKGLLPEIDARPLPQMDLPPDKERGWRKLSLFRKDVGLEGRVLFLDLDTVIVGNIDGYFTMDGKFIFIKHWKPSEKHGIGETGVYRFEAGELQFLYDDFMANMEKIKASYRHEQAYVGDVLSKRGLAGFWPSEWMPSQIHLHEAFPAELFPRTRPAERREDGDIPRQPHARPGPLRQGQGHKKIREVRQNSRMAQTQLALK